MKFNIIIQGRNVTVAHRLFVWWPNIGLLVVNIALVAYHLANWRWQGLLGSGGDKLPCLELSLREKAQKDFFISNLLFPNLDFGLSFVVFSYNVCKCKD